MKRLISFAVIFMLIACMFVAGCDNTKNPGNGTVADNTKYYDAITSKCKLSKAYTGKSFLDDGIGVATVAYYTDGDTTTFHLVEDNMNIALRYQAIDTPESTGGVEKWGKAAANFTKRTLESAVEIVLEAPAVPAEHDSYGTRYLGYVWYRTSENGDFRNLNLELIENGFSYNKATNTSKYPYYAQMKQAEDFARSIKLRQFSDLPDPLYSEDPIDITIKEIFDDIKKVNDKQNPYYDPAYADPDRPDYESPYYSFENNAGAKVRFNALIKDYKVSATGTFMFTAVQLNEDGTPSNYTMNLYAGYSSSPASNMKLGHVYRVVGAIQMHSGALQLSGLIYDTTYGEDEPTYTHPVQKQYYLIFDSSVSYDPHYSETLFSDVTVTSVNYADGYYTIVGECNQVKKAGLSETVSTYTFKYKADENSMPNLKVGAKFATTGYQYEAKSGVITVTNIEIK